MNRFDDQMALATGAGRAMVDDMAKHYGQLDIAVHCVADNAHSRVTERDEESFDNLIRSNVHLLFWLARDAHTMLSKTPDADRLTYISSSPANRTFVPGLIPYMATKAYMNVFAHSSAALSKL